jgi:hypothetical protein
MKPTSKTGWIRRGLLIAGIFVLLEFVPGSYTIDSFQDEWEPESQEGKLLLALERMDLEAKVYFERPTRHRISRNAELLLPADITLTLEAAMTPEIIDGEAVARPRIWNLSSSRQMTFVYRGVTVARARRMRIRSEDTELRVQALGTYRILSALATASRYHRQREIKRDYQVPDTATLSVASQLKPLNRIGVTESVTAVTGPQGGQITLDRLRWEKGRWTGGEVDIDLTLSSVEALLDAVVREALSDPLEVGGILAVNFRRLHALTLEKNRLFFHVDGSITSANSQTVGNVFDPSFETRLEVVFDFPEGEKLEDAILGARLKQVHSFDINRSHNLLDKSVRNLFRRYRDEASAEIALVEHLPDIPAIPQNLIFDTFELTPAGADTARLKIGALLFEQ